jgi:hypothetical protein
VTRKQNATEVAWNEQLDLGGEDGWIEAGEGLVGCHIRPTSSAETSVPKRTNETRGHYERREAGRRACHESTTKAPSSTIWGGSYLGGWSEIGTAKREEEEERGDG